MNSPPKRSLAAATAIVLLLCSAAPARADFSLFGSYWENIAREAAQNDANAVRQLLGTEHSVNETDENGRTGLVVCAMNGNIQIAAILIKAGATLDAQDRLGNTALHYAIERDHADIAKLLLDAGAVADPQNRDGMTPLMIAASRGRVDLVSMLLAKGASAKKTDYTGRDAVSWAEEGRRTKIAQQLRAASR